MIMILHPDWHSSFCTRDGHQWKTLVHAACIAEREMLFINDNKKIILLTILIRMSVSQGQYSHIDNYNGVLCIC
jgi:hypothetical protein